MLYNMYVVHFHPTFPYSRMRQRK